jgi:pSer/pThr/pTyr-binding forkhead associated (FHA) protein
MPGLRFSTSEGVKIRPLRETLTIGRDARNDLALSDDPKVSRQHARIRHEGDTYVIEDLQSRNGTFLERESEVTRITSPQQLRSHDVVRVGSTRLVFNVDVVAETPPGTPPASKPDAPPRTPEEPEVVTEVFEETKVGRYPPGSLEPPAESIPSPQPAAPPLREVAQRIAELEQQLAELKTQLAKKQG